MEWETSTWTTIWRTIRWTSHTIRSERRASSNNEARLHQFGKKVLVSSIFMGCALHAERRLDSLQTLMIYRKTTHSKCVCVCQKKKIKRSSRAETRNSWLPRANGHVKLAGEGSGVRPSDRIQQDTEERERKTQQWSSRRDGRTRFCRTTARTRWSGSKAWCPGVSLEASFAVITFKKGKFNCTCHSKAYCQSHSKRLTLSGGNTVQWTYCKNVEWIIKKVGWIIIGTLMSIGNYHGHGPVLPSAVYWTTFHLKDTCGPERDWQRSKHRSGPNTYGQKVVRLCRKQLNEEEASNEQSAMPCKLKNHQYKDPVANPPTEKKKTRTHRRRPRVYEKAFGRDSIKKSQRSHCGERVPLVESRQSCAQVRSHAPSGKKSGCKSSSG